MLRKIRLTLAVLFFALITLLFLDFTGTLHAWFGWMAKIQFLPALLALNVGVVLALVVLTLVLGRVYCSVICPLGVFQDIVAWFSKKAKKNRYRYSPALSWLRYSVLGVFVIALVAGVHSFVALLAPYSSYGRIANNLFAPVYQWGNNLLAYLAERADSYAFYDTTVWLKSVPTFVIAAVTLVVLIVLAWRGGRTYCNTICPVGTILGFLSRYAYLKPVIDTDKCINCNLCARNCKASCIDLKSHRIDYSRCVACMDCIDKCKHQALSYRHPAKAKTAVPEPEPEKNSSRRAFLASSALAASAAVLKAQEMKVDGGLATIEDKKIPNRHTPIPATRSAGSTTLRATLHSLPALRIGVPQRSTASFHRTDDTDAALLVVRARLLPPRVYQVLGSLPHGSYQTHHRGRQVVHPNRTCRMDQAQLCGEDRQGRMRQLCPPLPHRCHHHGAFGSQQPRFA